MQREGLELEVGRVWVGRQADELLEPDLFGWLWEVQGLASLFLELPSPWVS